MTTLNQETTELAEATAKLLIAELQAKPTPVQAEFDGSLFMLRLLISGQDWITAEALAHDLARRFRVKRLEAHCDEAGVVKDFLK